MAETAATRQGEELCLHWLYISWRQLCFLYRKRGKKPKQGKGNRFFLRSISKRAFFDILLKWKRTNALSLSHSISVSLQRTKDRTQIINFCNSRSSAISKGGKSTIFTRMKNSVERANEREAAFLAYLRTLHAGNLMSFCSGPSIVSRARVFVRQSPTCSSLIAFVSGSKAIRSLYLIQIMNWLLIS